MRRAAAPQVDLDGLNAPPVLIPHCDEVHRGTAQHPFAGQPPPHLEPFCGERRRVFGRGREVAPEVGLAVWTAEDLVVRGENVHLPGGAHAQLHARAPKVRAFDALLHDPALLVEGVEVVVGGCLRVLQLERSPEIVVRAPEIELRVPETAQPAVQLDDCPMRVRPLLS